MFRKYVEYLKDNPNHYWFKRKLYGWGWTPATLQGWLVTLVYILLLVTSVFILRGKSAINATLFVVSLVILTSIFIFIACKKGEKPRWQWGKGEEDLL